MKNSSYDTYTYDDGVYTFEGNVSVQKQEDWVLPWRINYDQKRFFPFLWDGENPGWTYPVAGQCSGVRLCFTTDAVRVILHVNNHLADLTLDLVVNGQLIKTFISEKDAEEIAFGLPDDGFKRVELWLDQRHAFRLRKLILNAGAKIRKTEVIQKRWVHYGSSISHSRTCGSPTNIWAARVAKNQNLHLTNLGFGGNCVMEPMMARLIRDMPADFITLKLGINIYNGHLVKRTFAPGVIGLIQTIRDKHPETPIAVISPIHCPARENIRKVEQGLTLVEMRNILEEIVKIFTKYGDANIFYVDGLKLLGEKEVFYLHDGLHPDAKSQLIIAEHFEKEVFEHPIFRNNK